MININSNFSPKEPLNMVSKTWHTAFDNGKVSGYISDFKTESHIIKEDDKIIKQFGMRVFVNEDAKKRGGYSFFVPHDPYFYIIPKKGHEKELILYLKKGVDRNNGPVRMLKGTDGIKDIRVYNRHVFGSGDSEQFINFIPVFKVILYSPYDVKTYSALFLKNPNVLDCREHDINYRYQISFDLQLFCYRYYNFIVENGVLRRYEQCDNETMPQLEVFTFDIEVRKKPVKKPQPDDKINVIGVKFGDRGYIINNIELTHFELPNFWIGVDKERTIRRFTEDETKQKGLKYPPLHFTVINTNNEKETIQQFYNLINKFQPQSINGYASDFFDYPHLQVRGQNYGIDFTNLFYRDGSEGKGDHRDGTFVGDFKRDGVAMFDTMDWTERDSYMSKGMRGLKDITRELLGIHAIEIDHDEQVRVWQHMEDVLINPNYSDNADPEVFKINQQKAFQQSFDHATYCASDVYVTDIFATQSSLGLNIAVATRVPMNLFETSRKTRGPMVESYLLNRASGKMIAPNKVMKKSRDKINPVEIIKNSGSITKEVNKTIKNVNYKFWAECKTAKQMEINCRGCNDNNCKENWRRIWRLNSDKHVAILCNKESEGNDDEDQVYYYPLENQEFLVVDEKYEGARVKCISAGVFKDNAKTDFKIDVDNFKEFEGMLHEALDRLIERTERKNRPVKGYKNDMKIKILNVKSLHEKITERFNSVFEQLQKNEEDDGLYWNGYPVIIHVDVSSMYPNIILTYNLQPYSVVTEEICRNCKYRPKDDEPNCWKDMDWNAVYKVMNISKVDQEKAEKFIRSEIEKGREFENDEDIENIYKRFAGSGKMFNVYKFPVKSRFCQKSFKFFVDSVKSFRDSRYVYKNMMVDKENEIAKLSTEYSSNPHFENLMELYNTIGSLSDEKINAIKNSDLINNVNTPKIIAVTILELLNSYNKESGKIPEHVTNSINKIKKIYGNKEIPENIKIIIDKLSIEKTYARNMQLAMKVLLNSLYGYLKSTGARFWSIDSAGATCLKGHEIIEFAIRLSEEKMCGINIEFDTDGLWCALPSSIPLELEYNYKVVNEPDQKIYTDKFNLFNENLNYLIKKEFTNDNNYVPVNERGEYDSEIEYDEKWNRARRWKNEPLCEIKFDYDGPFSTLFVYTKKRMKVYKRSKSNPEEQEVDTITGLEELRKGELELIRVCSKEITDAYCESDSIQGAYKRACDVVNNYITQIENHTLDLNLILESRDLSERSAPKVKQAYQMYKKFLSDYNIDPMKFPVHSNRIKKATANNTTWENIWFGEKDGRKKISEGILSMFTRNPYSMTAFRVLDMGGHIETDDTVQWIISQYPRTAKKTVGTKTSYEKESVSQRAIPSILFNSTPDEIRKCLERWFGEPVTSIEIQDYVDWDFYLEKFTSMITRYIIIPAKAQNIDVYKWLKLKRPNEKKAREHVSLLDFNKIHPLSALNKSNKKN